MSNHLRKVPYVEQLQQTECGICCVTMILGYYKNKQSLATVRKELEVGRDGLNLSSLAGYLRTRGMEAKVYKVSAEQLVKLPTPAVIFWEYKHFVVLEKINENRAVIVDPAFGRRILKMEEFAKGYSEVVMLCSVTDKYVPQKEKNRVWQGIFSEIFHQKRLFAGVIMVSLVAYLLQLGIPIIIQYLTDHIVEDGKGLPGETALLVMVCILLYSLSVFFQGKKMLKLQIKLDRFLSEGTFGKLLKLPYRYFESRTNGDLLFRLNSLTLLRDLLSDQLVKGILEAVSMLFIICYMLVNSPKAAMYALGIVALTGVFIILMRSKILEVTQNEIIENTKLNSMKVETVYSILGIKMSGMEAEIRENWEACYQKALEAYQRKNMILNCYSTVILILKTAGPLVILCGGLLEYVYGRTSIGSVLAVYSLSHTLFHTAIGVFNMWNDFVTSHKYLERIQDILMEQEEADGEEEIPISGDISFDHVSFCYTGFHEPVLKDLNFQIKKGEKVAIVGSSGSGKSTLTKLLLGLYEPTSGRICFDTRDVKTIRKKSLRSQIGIVPQDMSLFNKTILDNITMSNRNISLDTVKKAAKIAQVSEEIERMPMKYHTFLNDLGMNLSGGQRQRIVLARALVHRPPILILDEATSSLDNLNEKRVSEYLKEMGCTRIVVAHRLSTIVDADRIFVLQDGRIVESGNHESLMKKCDGIYRGLYTRSVSA